MFNIIINNTFKYASLQIKQPDLSMAWLAVSEEGVTVLELASMAVIGRYALNSIGLFGGLQVKYVYLTLT